MYDSIFVIAIYEVDESRVIRGKSGKQIAFDQPKAKLVRTVSRILC
jgi:hypothetical protein